MQSITFNTPLVYKELIKVFNLEFKEGGYRKRQLEKLMREYNIIKYGKHYIIIEELCELDKLSTKPRLKFQDYIVPLIYTYMNNGKYKGEVTITKGNMLKDLSMINDNFYAVREDPYKYAIMLDENLDGFNLMRYTEATYKMMCNSLDSACSELANRKLAFVSKIKMMLKVYENKDGTVTRKGIPLNDTQLKKLLEIQRDYMDSHIDEKTNLSYEFWTDIPYMELRDATKWVKDRIGYNTFDGYKILINEKGIEKYIAQNFPEMKRALSSLVEYKIANSTRKGIGNISKDTRVTLARELHSNKNELNLKPRKEIQ
jgi:hypothetical protein